MKTSYYTIIISLACIVVVLASFRSTEPEDKPIAYPEGYRTWTHVKSWYVNKHNPAFKTIGGFNHVYANKIAMKGYKAGTFPDGSIIVNDVIAAHEDSISVREDSTRYLVMMVKDSKRFPTTDGWGFEGFRGTSKTTRMMTATSVGSCYSCHKVNKDMVFSKFREN